MLLLVVIITNLKQLYQDVFRTPDYFWFDPYSLEFAGFKLNYRRYEQLVSNEQGWLWSDELQLYLGVVAEKLRFFTFEGKLVPTPEEAEAQDTRKSRGRTSTSWGGTREGRTSAAKATTNGS